MTRDEHDHILSTYTLPDEIIATKASSASEEWFEGAGRDLRHDVYKIRTDDPAKLRYPERVFAFDQVVDVGGVRLTSLEHLHDLLTTKIWVLENLRGQYLPKINVRTMAIEFNAWLWMIRWRTGLGVARFDGLAKPLFENFCDRLKRGALALVPFEQRLNELCQQVLDGRLEWPSYRSQSRIRLDAGTLAERLGLTSKSAMTSPFYLQEIAAAIRRTSPDHSARISLDADELGVDADEDEISGRALTPSSAKTYLIVWADLHHLSQVGCLHHDRLPFDPFAEVDMLTRARQIGKASSGRTDTPAPEQWLALLDAAALWVLDYSGPILKVVEGAIGIERKYRGLTRVGLTYRLRNGLEVLIAEHFPHKEERPKLLPLWYRAGAAAGMDGLSLNEAVKYIVAACLILVGGLSARRAGELESLQAGCATVDAFGEHWLSSYIEKTIRDLDKLPIPSSVSAAVSILEDLSRTGRERTGELWLMNIDRPNAEFGRYSERIGYNLALRHLLNDFANMAGIPKPEGIKDWRFAPHQLRRAFSIYYYHGNRYGNLDALSRFLRHFDPEMTRVYITEILGGMLGRLNELARAYSKKSEALAAQAKESEELATAAGKAHALAKMAQEAYDAARLRLAIHEEVRQEDGVERMLDIYDGVEVPIGLGAPALYDDLDKLVEKASAHVRLQRPGANVSPEDVRIPLTEGLRDYVKTHYLEPVSGGFAHCRCTIDNATDLERAVCLQRKRAETNITKDTRPDYAYASIEDCLGGCPFGLALSDDQATVQKIVARGREAAKGKGSAIAEGLVATLMAAQQATATHGRKQ
ncbi:hypothetical protein GAY29_06535 [Azospirillum brasilense]|uniref:hypothetical protein n=1 Tax=Azospirillum brasilense TaxID=192 RepID=UPI00190C73C4|nr:hypothetical protein [Azospirillum brasilense]MBK3732771.1 hypothetical protein [Azospirillum brasilense]